MDVRISLLADRPEFIPALAEGTQAEYAERWPERTLAWRMDRYRRHCHRPGDDLPIAWVVHEGDRVFGTAALRAHDVDEPEHLTPWLGGVFVFPAFRREGHGAALCATVEQAARDRGVETLYLGTFDNQAWYRSLGWTIQQPGTVQGRTCDIMSKRLG